MRSYIRAKSYFSPPASTLIGDDRDVREILLDLEASSTRPRNGLLCFLDWRGRAAVNSRNRVAGDDGGTRDKERAIEAGQRKTARSPEWRLAVNPR